MNKLLKLGGQYNMNPITKEMAERLKNNHERNERDYAKQEEKHKKRIESLRICEETNSKAFNRQKRIYIKN